MEHKHHKLIIKYQSEEEAASIVCAIIAAKIKNALDKETLLKISAQKKEHAEIWKRYSGKNIPANRFRIMWHIILNYITGYTFLIKFFNKSRYADYEILAQDIPELAEIIENEKMHERALAEMLDEERLKYTGAVVLGLNDALIEFTGILAGLTFALANTKVISLTGIITGTAATLSMAGSEYLAERAEANPKALQASIYTGFAYLITVALLLLPYILFPKHMYVAAFVIMMTTAILIIFFFTYYISIAKTLSFKKQFSEMACISIGVAIAAFIIGIAAKKLLGIDI
ncbi:MAG: VIT1/CCC1 transporter family protein [Endomicrobia bacterium]|nr:VIT1/CCC1 transporter family protein [Endomicrobiia bacterium]MCL2506235.1 VIT1/CCC1 transporter family protein [Endomicrobiia bacterium]